MFLHVAHLDQMIVINENESINWFVDDSTKNILITYVHMFFCFIC